ncbi:MAG: creatininase family protein [Ignavibacteriales bacterium]|nr:creatininase family protein [Ignavibacteriales bacterium]
MNTRQYILSETNWKAVKSGSYKVAILPWGATEPHNYHLPYAADIIESEYISKESARIAWERGGKVIVLPAIPFGVNTGQLDIKLTINMKPSTQFIVLHDIVDSLHRHGLNKLVILNSHGGNDFKQMIRELKPQFPKMFICQINWYQILEQAKYFEERDDHAGEMETSVLLNIAPDLVLPLSEAGAGKEKKFKLRGLRERLAWAPREWTKASEDTGVGNPKKASVEKGKQFLLDVTNRIADFFVELSAADINDLYEE